MIQNKPVQFNNNCLFAEDPESHMAEFIEQFLIEGLITRQGWEDVVAT